MSNNFFKYYYENVLKQWWNLLLLIPAFINQIISLMDINVDIVKNISDTLNLYVRIILLLIILLVVHIIALYKLWKVKNNESISMKPENIPDDIYENIAKMVDKFMPEKSKDFRENFSEAQKLFRNSSSNTKLLITQHYASYKIIKDFFDNKDSFSIKSKDFITIKENFNKNFSYLNEYNKYIGNNETKKIDDTKARDIISKINDNLISLFSYF
jgi:hypothetical protein